jgi:hypothetical protein
MDDAVLLQKLSELKADSEKLAYDDRANKDRISKRLEMLIRNKFGNESHYLSDLIETDFDFHAGIWFSDVDYSPDERRSWEDGKSKWINLIDTMVEELTSFPQDEVVVKIEKEANKSRRIFIVHGHDNEMVQSSALFVRQIGFDPVILREQPNQGRTIIEKFEDYADVPFAIVLFSPDDLGKAADEDSLKPRPRQNVVFELGFFIGKLGRNKVVVLHKVVENFEMLSDFQGVIFEPYKDGWEFKVAKEIKAAGFDVDFNKLL